MATCPLQDLKTPTVSQGRRKRNGPNEPAVVASYGLFKSLKETTKTAVIGLVESVENHAVLVLSMLF
jgi:hypothetical protein